ncbi:MAG: hypothetical protein ABIP12_03895 [Terriglobales bacterium]
MHTNRSPKAVALDALLVGALLLLSTPVFAQRAATSDRAADEKAKQESVTAPTGAASGIANISVSAKTSQLREPTRDEVELLLEGMAPSLSTSTEGLELVRHDNGAISLDLQGRFQNITIAKIEADGSISQRCVTSKEEARQFLTQITQKPATKSAAQSSATLPKAKPALEEK